MSGPYIAVIIGGNAWVCLRGATLPHPPKEAYCYSNNCILWFSCYKHPQKIFWNDPCKEQPLPWPGVINVFRPELFLPRVRHAEFRGLLCKRKKSHCTSDWGGELLVWALTSLCAVPDFLQSKKWETELQLGQVGWESSFRQQKGAGLFCSGLARGAKPCLPGITSVLIFACQGIRSHREKMPSFCSEGRGIMLLSYFKF